MEIFNTKGDAQDMSIDSLRFFESTEYTGNDKVSTSYFDNKGSLTGKEQIEYNPNGIAQNGKFFDPNGKLLSYYDYITNATGDIIAEYGFDATNNQLLSVKTFDYDNEGKIKTRKVFEGDHTLYRRYDFAFDTNGNETSMTVSDNQGSLVLKEEFKITKQDSLNKWTEKWGFVNDSPVTFYKKS